MDLNKKGNSLANVTESLGVIQSKPDLGVRLSDIYKVGFCHRFYSALVTPALP